MKITAKQYAQTFYDLTDGKSKPEIEKSVADFARYIYKERKLKLAEKIIEQFSKLYNQQRSIVEAEVMSAHKLESPEIHKVESYIKKKFEAREVVLKNIINENIKGGLIVKVGDEVMDGSIRGRLDDLKKAIA